MYVILGSVVPIHNKLFYHPFHPYVTEWQTSVPCSHRWAQSSRVCASSSSSSLDTQCNRQQKWITAAQVTIQIKQVLPLWLLLLYNLYSSIYDINIASVCSYIQKCRMTPHYCSSWDPSKAHYRGSFGAFVASGLQAQGWYVCSLGPAGTRLVCL